MNEPSEFLEFRWTVSRGRDTAGHNICSLWVKNKKVASCCGGGFDMKGTVLGEYMRKFFQEKLVRIAKQAHAHYSVEVTGECLGVHPTAQTGIYYGMYAYWLPDGRLYKVSLDGACGFEAMRKILEKIGYTLRFLNESKHKESYLLEGI
jgi:hypothetical protein